MNHKNIHITEKDRSRLGQLMLYCDFFTEQDQKILRKLNYDISHGRVVSEYEMPRNIVGIHSQVELQEIISGIKITITLVFPEEDDPKNNRISILTPIGMALLGSKIGDIIEYGEPHTVYNLVIQNTIRPHIQPDNFSGWEYK